MGGHTRLDEAPDFEAPNDDDGDGIFALEVTASDGFGGSTTQAFQVEIVDVDEAPELRSGEAVSVVENTIDTGYVATAVDPEGDEITYALGGADAGQLVLDPSSGALVFLDAPDFERPLDEDADNAYRVTVSAADPAGNTDTLDVTVTVTDDAGNEAPTFTSSATVAVPENTVGTGYVATAQDEEGDAFVFAVAGGADADAFSIDADSGVLTFVAAPNFEAPTDSDADNVYAVRLSVADAEGSTTLDLEVTVSNVNEFDPVFTSGASGIAAENQTTTDYVATATDADAQVVTFAITGGDDAAAFVLDGTTGILGLAAPLDFEAPSDADQDNGYEVEITADDGDGRRAAIVVTIDLVDDIEPPVFTSTTTASTPEGTTVTGYVAMATAPGETVVYAVGGGPDAARFDIDPATGALSFVDPPDFEAPADADQDNAYEVVLSANATATANLAVTVFVTNVDEAPRFGGAFTGTADEGLTTTTALAQALDPEGTAVTYVLAGGPDAASLTIDATTGVITFAVAQDFEAPADADGNNDYLVTVEASSGGLTATQDFVVSVVDVNEAPAFTSPAAANLPENQVATGYTAAAADPEGAAPTYSVAGGPDAAFFTVDPSTGQVTLVAPLDFEAPQDADANNVYEVSFSATDGTFTVTLDVDFTVVDVGEVPVFSSPTTGVAPENTTATGYTALASVPGGAPVTYAIAGGADAARFSIDPNGGGLTFVQPLDFEAPADADTDNVYEVSVSATANGLSVQQLVQITVNDVNESPVFVSGTAGSADEGQPTTTFVAAATDPDGTPVLFTLTGSRDDARFSVGATTGVLSFLAPPDFEAPADDDADNQYVVQITGTSGGDTIVTTVTITVVDVDEAPVFTSGTSASVAENETTIGYTAAATDPEGGVVTLSISGGADAAAFALNAGVLSFAVAPDFEAPTDAGGDNGYVVDLTATDGTNPVTQTVTVTVTDVPRVLYVDFPPEGANLGGVASTAIAGSITDATVAQVSSVLVDGQPAAVVAGNPVRFSVTRTAPGGSATYSVQSNYVGGGSDTLTRTVNNQAPIALAEFVDYDALNGDAIVTDTGGGTLVRVDIATGVRTVLSGDSASGQAFSGPRDLAFDATNGRVLVVDDGRDSVFSVDAATGARTEISTAQNSGPQLSTPRGVGYDPGGNRLFVTDNGQDALIAVDLVSGNRTAVSGLGVGFGPTLFTPNDVAYDAQSGTAYVTEELNDAIIAVDVTTGARTVLSDDTTGAGPTFTRPRGIVLDGGRLLVVDDVTDQIVSVDLTTGNRTLVVDDAVGAGPNLVTPFDLALGAAGQIIVVDANLGVLTAASLTGDRSVVSAVTNVGVGVSLDGSEDLVYDDANRQLVVIDNNQINAVDLEDLSRSVLSSSSVGSGTTFSNLRRCVLDGADLLVTDSTRDAVFRVDLTTGDRTVVSDDTVGAGPVFGNPQGLTIDRARNRLLVTDTSLDAIVDVDLATGDRTVIVGAGVSISDPDDIVLDAANDRALLAVDGFPNTGVVAFDAVSQVRTLLSGTGAGGATTGAGPSFLEPTTVELGGSSLFVSESILRLLVEVDPLSGDRTIVSGSNGGVTVGAGPDFQEVTAVALDAARGRAFVFDADSNFDTVVIIDLASGQRAHIAN